MDLTLFIALMLYAIPILFAMAHHSKLRDMIQFVYGTISDDDEDWPLGLDDDSVVQISLYVMVFLWPAIVLIAATPRK